MADTSGGDIDLSQRLRWYVLIRWFLLWGLALGGILPQLITTGITERLQASVTLALVGFLTNAIFYVVTRPRWQRTGLNNLIAAGQIGLDIILASVLLLENGGIESRSIIVYAIPIIMGGIVLGRSAVYLTGLLCALAYNVIILLDYLAVIRPNNVIVDSLHRSPTYLVLTAFFYTAVIITLTFITAFLVRMIRARERLSQEMKGLSAEKAKTEAMLKTLGGALIAIDSSGNITLVNDAFQEITGWQRREVVGAKLDDILPVLDENGKRLSAEQRPLMHMLHPTASGLPPRIQHISRYYYAKKNGETFPFVGFIAPIVLHENIIGATCIFEDATAIRQMHQLRSNFVALASHQLKTPLSEIRGYTDNMLNGITGPITEKQIAYLNTIKDITLRANKLIADLLDIEIIERGNVRLNIQPTKLSSVMADLTAIYHDRLTNKGLRLKFIEPHQQLTVMADKDKLVEIVGNVLINAVSYTKKQSTITIRTKIEKGFGVILVSDKGKGMDPGVIESIFQKGTVLSAAPKAEGGTGFGLYLAKQLLELQKGEIDVLSSSSKGTTIRIKVPLGGQQA